MICLCWYIHDTLVAMWPVVHSRHATSPSIPTVQVQLSLRSPQTALGMWHHLLLKCHIRLRKYLLLRLYLVLGYFGSNWSFRCPWIVPWLVVWCSLCPHTQLPVFLGSSSAFLGSSLRLLYRYILLSFLSKVICMCHILICCRAPLLHELKSLFTPLPPRYSSS